MRPTARRLLAAGGIFVAAALWHAPAPVHAETSPAGESKKAAIVPEKDQKALDATLDKVYAVLPIPLKAFRRERDADDREIAPVAPAKSADGAWTAPATARATHSYRKPARKGSGADDFVLEMNVYLNSEALLADPLASAGGAMRVDRKDDALFVRHSLAGIDESRVAVPLSAEARKEALTVVRVYVAAPEAEGYLSDLAQGRRPDGSPWDGVPAATASDVRTIVVEFHGPAEEVDRLADATPVAKLRALLTP